jgi:5-formyltetrahydrofolate cyclo-ligase
MSVSPQKSKLRDSLSVTRDEFFARSGAEACRNIRASFLHWTDANKFTGRVFAYAPIGGEPDLSEIWRSRQFALALPRIQQARAMDFFAYQHGDTLIPNKFNIPEPAAGSVMTPSIEDVMLIPALGFTTDGYRIGYGGGFYDRYIARLTTLPRIIIVSYDALLVPDSTEFVEPHDIQADWILTESGIAPRSDQRL